LLKKWFAGQKNEIQNKDEKGTLSTPDMVCETPTPKRPVVCKAKLGTIKH